MITIREIPPEAIETIIPLLQELDTSLSEATLKARLHTMMQQGYRCVGAYDERELVGVSGVWLLHKYYVGTHVEMDNVVIVPAYRNRGIGHQLIAWIEAFAKAQGCVASELNCYVHNEAAQRFWDAAGYEVIGLHYQKKL